ncbi:MAG: aldo/keto reductase [Firmicutes bacterium HGW-Firmicutes-7]|nr:MAG: aldo/keto reductase [Firmicutes bacterium HGW-Firmicutes-7]
MNSLQDCTTLNNGIKMPWLGFGVNRIHSGFPMQKAIKNALEAGYRSFDTATLYLNEKSLGDALKNIDIPREELFITSKLWTMSQSYSATLKAFEKSKKNLSVDYIDLYLINSPVTKYDEAWRAMVELYHTGQIKAIGVCNFNISHLEHLQSISEVIPAVNQVEFHPWLTQEKLLEYCQKNEIQMEAWSPLARGEVLKEKTLLALGKKHKKTSAQIILRWALQQKVVTIPKSVHKEWIFENTNIFDFNLSDEDMLAISSLNINKRWMWSYGM